MSAALARDTKDALRLCYDFMQIYGDIFMDSDFYPLKKDYIAVRKEVVGVLKRHEKKDNKEANKC
jgi:hypothetical protein